MTASTLVNILEGTEGRLISGLCVRKQRKVRQENKNKKTKGIFRVLGMGTATTETVFLVGWYN